MKIAIPADEKLDSQYVYLLEELHIIYIMI